MTPDDHARAPQGTGRMGSQNRLTRERRTVRLMIEMYCRARHGTRTGLCESCEELSRYASMKIDRCVFHDAKPVCAECRVHCYKADMRDRIRRIMRFSGPRMLFSHPGLALMHGLDRMRKPAAREEGAP